MESNPAETLMLEESVNNDVVADGEYTPPADLIQIKEVRVARRFAWEGERYESG